MAKLNTKQASKVQRAIIFGPPKSGKSQLAGDLSTDFNLIWVDMENGHDTLFKLSMEQQERIELINLPDTRSYPIAIETCLKMIKGPVSICDEHGKNACMLCKKEGKEIIEVDLNNLDADSVVVFDSLTQLTNSAIANITRGKPDDYKLTYDDWGNLGKLMDIFLSHIQQASYNVICISHETEAELEDGKKRIVPVAGTRNFSRNVAKYFDHVIYAQVKNKKHVFASCSIYHNSILTGSRTDIELESAEGGLMNIFKPGAAGSSSSEPVSPKCNPDGASDILARLKNRTKT